jgi:hypothetical protein
VKSRFCTIPFTRARTSATRKGEVRPGSSRVRVRGAAAMVTTPTSTGPAGAGGGDPEPQAARRGRRASGRDRRWEVRIVMGIVKG